MSSNHPGGYHLSGHRLVTLEQSSTYFTEVSSFMTSKLVSSFELLAQPIIPSAFAPAGIENPFVVQAYFLDLLQKWQSARLKLLETRSRNGLLQEVF